MRTRKAIILFLMVWMLFLLGSTVYAQGGTKTVELQVDGMV